MLEFVKLQLQLPEHFGIEIQTIRASLRTFSDDRIGLFGVAYEIRGNLFVDEIIIERLKKRIVCIEDIAGDVLDSKPILSGCKQKVYDYFLVIHVKSLKKVTLN